MKSIVCLIALFALAQAERDWSKIYTREVNPVTKQVVKVPLTTRIVGGHEAQKNAYPYQAALFIPTTEGTYFCGGSLISPEYVLTAAHCADGATIIEVVLGAHNITDSTEATQVTRYSSEISVHPDWNEENLVNDIAILKLELAAPINDQIQVISLPTRLDSSNVFSGRNAVVTGWGKPSDAASSISPVLNYVQVPVITNLNCNILYLGLIHPDQVCTAGDDSKGPCSGDSGGPLVVDNKVIGVVSFGLSIGCEIGWPVVYTRTTSFTSFIEQHSDVKISDE